MLRFALSLRETAIAADCARLQKPSETESFMEDRIEIEFRAVVDGRGDEFGVIRELSADGLIVYVKNAGDFFVSFETIKALDSRKVIFKCDKLDRRLQRAIKDARDTPRPREVFAALSK
jgi:hypothetical protein